MAHRDDVIRRLKQDLEQEAIYMAEWLSLSGYKAVHKPDGVYWIRDSDDYMISGNELYSLFLNSF